MTTVTAAAQTQVLSTAKVMETWNPYASRATPTRGWVILWLTAYYMDRTILGVDDPEIGDQVNRARCSCGRSESAKFVVGSCCCRFRFLIKACPEFSSPWSLWLPRESAQGWESVSLSNGGTK